MDTPLKQRLIGAAVLIALAVFFLPMLVKGPAPDSGVSNVSTDIPDGPEGASQTRDLPLAAPGDVPQGGAVGMDATPVDRPATDASASTPPAGDSATATDPAAASADPAAATDATAAVGLPPAVAGGNYAVHFGAYATQKAADTVAALAKKSQLPAYSEPATVGGKAAWRVRIGPFATRADAESARLKALDVRSDVPVRVVVLDAESAPATPAAAEPTPAPAVEAPKPVAAKPSEPSEPKPAELKPAAPKPVAPKPTVVAKPTPGKPIDTAPKPVAAKPVQSKPVETKPASTAATSAAVAAKPVAPKPADPKPVATAPKPAVAKPAVAKPSTSTDSGALVAVAPKPKPTAAAKVGFAVQLGAFSAAADANALRDRLRASGFAAFTETVSTDKGSLTRVRVGPVVDRAAADQLKAQVQAKTGVEGIVRPHP
ncbi:MAG: sporulation protein [Lysobacter sp.]|nr:MAG: sporulation protein [Lysobacter sp.]